MNLSAQIAKHLREVYFGGNWTTVNMKDTLKDVTWQQATEQVHSFNTIATLFNHLTYYVGTVTKVLQGEALVSKDELSFVHPPINSQEDWETIQNKAWEEAETFVLLIENLPGEKLWDDFTDKK